MKSTERIWEEAAAIAEVEAFDYAQAQLAARQRGDMAAEARWLARRLAADHIADLLREQAQRRVS